MNESETGDDVTESAETTKLILLRLGTHSQCFTVEVIGLKGFITH